MKILFLIGFLCLSFFAIAEDEKVYTQKEFDKKLAEEVDKKIDIIKKKSVSELTKELLEKERALIEREKKIKRQEEIHQANVVQLKKQVANFEGQQQKILGCISSNKKQANKRLTNLVQVISNMKPVKASELLSVQDTDISVRILQMIDPTKASKIFNLMDKEISARLQKQYLNMKK